MADVPSRRPHDRFWPFTSLAATQHFGRFRCEADIDPGIRPLRVMMAALHHSSSVIRLIGKEAEARPA